MREQFMPAELPWRNNKTGQSRERDALRERDSVLQRDFRAYVTAITAGDKPAGIFYRAIAEMSDLIGGTASSLRAPLECGSAYLHAMWNDLQGRMLDASIGIQSFLLERERTHSEGDEQLYDASRKELMRQLGSVREALNKFDVSQVEKEICAAYGTRGEDVFPDYRLIGVKDALDDGRVIAKDGLKNIVRLLKEEF